MLTKIPKGKKQPLLDALDDVKHRFAAAITAARNAQRPGLASSLREQFGDVLDLRSMISKDQEEE